MFVFAVYCDLEITRRLIADLRRYYPSDKLICLSDGAPDSEFAAFCQAQAVRFRPYEKRLKLPQFGGLWLERLFSDALLYSEAPYFIKTEGDTRFWRSFAELPQTDVAGTLNTRHDITFPRGGCVYLKRPAIVKILASGLLRDSQYCNNPKFSYDRYAEYRYADEVMDSRPVLLADLVLGDVIRRLGLSLSDWKEVSIAFRGLPPVRSFAATHPHHENS